MTKIKDLVSVTVDSAFVLFPIDIERYELFVAVAWEVQSLLNRGRPTVSPGLNEGVNSFIRHTNANFSLSARDFTRVMSEGPEGNYRPITVDRARRVQASIPNAAVVKLASRWNPDDMHEDVVLHLWLEFFVRFAYLHSGRRCNVRDVLLETTMGVETPNWAAAEGDVELTGVLEMDGR